MMKIINGMGGAIVLIQEDEVYNTFPEKRARNSFKIFHGIVVIDWETFRSMLMQLSVGELDDFYKEHGGEGKSITESFWWGPNKNRKKIIHPESEAKEIIIGAIFTELEEQV
jgi:hypothetical protein